MIKLEFNGKPFNPRTFEETIMKAAMEAAAEQLRERIGSIRHPETGEFPTIVVSGMSLSDMKLRVEGSPELLALVKQRTGFGSEEEGGEAGKDNTAAPKAFLSYAWEDRELAKQIATAMQANGIDTWWAEWCMSAGDSLRQKIDAGLDDCTHFVVLLTPVSLSKPWINQEMDAGLMLKLQQQVKFIPLRHQLSAEQLPPLLRGMLSPSVDDPTHDIGQVINDIHGISKKPPLGKVPTAIRETESTSTEYSAAATAIAKLFVESTRYARKFDPMRSIEQLATQTGLSEEDVKDAIHEMGELVTASPHRPVYPEDELFVMFDHFWMGWNPRADAVTLASDMLNDGTFPTEPVEIGKRYHWEARRLNPAMAYLVNRKLVRALKAMNGGPWLVVHIQKTDDTRRFVKSRP